MSLILSEFDCPCCGENHMDEETFQMFVSARKDADTPFRMNSGYRCESHNISKEVGGSPTSSHPKGFAGDIKCVDSWSRWKIVFALAKAGFKRIRVAKTFIHADDDPDKSQMTFGIYWWVSYQV